MTSRLGIALAGLCAWMVTACATDPAPDESSPDVSTRAASATTVSADDVSPADTAPPADLDDVESDVIALDASALVPAAGTSPDACQGSYRPAGGPCIKGYTCLWQDQGFQGERVIVRGNCGVNLTKVHCPVCTNGTHGNDGSFNDQMSSWRNSTSATTCWWFDTFARGKQTTMSAGAAHGSTSPDNNDEASSFGSCSVAN